VEEEAVIRERERERERDRESQRNERRSCLSRSSLGISALDADLVKVGLGRGQGVKG
jgi:hypothetical protein